MAEVKKQKITAGAYFVNSELFNVDVLAGMDNSATSYNASYELTCKKCHHVSKRRGNAKNLVICAGCKRTWDRENNSIIEAPKKAPAKKITPEKTPAKKVPVEEIVEDKVEEKVLRRSTRTKGKKLLDTSSEEEEENSQISDEDEVEEPVLKKREVPDHDAAMILKILKGEVKPDAIDSKSKTLKNDQEKTDLKDGEYYVEEILDYYDDYQERRWWRFYYVKWYGHEELSFIRADKFTDTKLLEKYERTLPTVNRFNNMFANPKITKKTGEERVGYRRKSDVEKDMEIVPIDEVIEEIKDALVEKRMITIVKLKSGQIRWDNDTSTLFIAE